VQGLELPRHERSDPPWSAGCGGSEGLGDASPGERGSPHAVGLGESPVPGKFKTPPHASHFPVMPIFLTVEASRTLM